MKNTDTNEIRSAVERHRRDHGRWHGQTLREKLLERYEQEIHAAHNDYLHERCTQSEHNARVHATWDRARVAGISQDLSQRLLTGGQS